MTTAIRLRGGDEVQKALGSLKKLIATDREKMLAMIGVEYVRDAQRNIREKHGPRGEAWPGPPQRGGQRLQDTRRLYNSITYQIASQRSVFIGTNVIYAALHQYGGTIRPKRKKMLFQPANRQIARQYSGDAKRDFPGAFTLRKLTRGGHVPLVRKKAGGGLELIGILRRESTIPASPYLGESERAWASIKKRLHSMVTVVWPGAKE